jgi:hypothetical protein
VKDDVARRQSYGTFKPGLTPDQRAHYRALETEYENLQDLHEWVGETDREYWIEPELKRIEAELDWIHLDLLYFGGWLQDKGKKQLSRRGRPLDPEIIWRDKRIAAHSLLLEAEGIPSKIAIASIMELYRVARSTVFAVRKRWWPLLREFGYDQKSPQKRRWWIETFASYCQDPRFQSK